MANIKSQIKRNKTNEKARERNRAVKSEIRTRAKNAVAAVGTETEEATLRLAVKRIDKAAAKGVIHKNQAANKKSGLMKRIAKLSEDVNA
ncbi:MAG TPA: 30S ribosomal protein S20 [Acidimicrobiales bacterium]